MNRPDHDLLSRWHVALNAHNFPDRKGIGFEHKGWMYDAKHMADEIPRLSHLFGMERRGELPTLHRQCSRSPLEPVIDNHLTCCLGVECRKCEALMALEGSHLKPEEIDECKAWTCAAHILNEKGKRMIDDSEGYVLTTDDRMYWQNVYNSLAQADSEEPTR